MRLHGPLYQDPEGTLEIYGYVRDAENEDRLTRVALRVLGNQLRVVPDEPAVEVHADPPKRTVSEIPVQRNTAIGADFELRPEQPETVPPR